MENIFDKIDQLTSKLKSLHPITTENQQKLDKKFRLEFNYNSNHMEGNTLTYGETELLLIFDTPKGDHSMREYEEMKAHDVAYRLIEDLAKEKERPLTEQNIKNLNEIILVRPFWKDAITQDGTNTRRLIKVGDYKEHPNSVRLQNGEIFHYTSPTDTPIEMQELMEWYRTESTHLHPVTLAAMLHYKFVRIHPFDDGNGRLSRLLMNYVFLKNDLPPVIIKSSEKNQYLRALHSADVGEFEPFITYIAEQLIWSLEISIKAAKGEVLEEAGDLQKEIALLTKQITSENKQTKHPSIVYETFTLFNKKVWGTVKDSLAQFDHLFGESNELHFINHMPESFEKKSMFDLPFVKDTAPTKVKIFGRDIYETNIELLKWELTMYGLKGAKSKPNVKTVASLEFKTHTFSIIISLGNDTITSKEYAYGNFMLNSDIEKLNIDLAKQMLEVIKTRIE